MSDAIFQICGVTVPPLIGRTLIMQRLWSSLTKPTPDHLQMIGPRYAGKTVLLHALVEKMSDASSPYKVVMYWDLGHQTPDSDDAFMSCLRDQLAIHIASFSNDYATHLRSAGGAPSAVAGLGVAALLA